MLRNETAFLRVAEVWKLQGGADKEHWRVVSDEVTVAVFCVEFDCKSSGIQLCIGRSFFSAHTGKSRENFCSFADFGQELCFGVPGYVSGYFEIASCACSFGVYDSSRDALSVEACQFFDQVDILKHYWSIVANVQGVLIVRDPGSLICG
jgi:hypothetical protein